MEPTETPLNLDRIRLVLVLGKFRVTERQANLMKIALGGSTTMTVTLPDHVDVRAGDLLTLYTEVLYDKAVATSIQ
jgi:hypothetical protein